MNSLPSAVSVRHLLTHEGGVADWSNYPDAAQFTMRAPTLDELSVSIVSQPLSFPLGTDRSYSNSGHIVLDEMRQDAFARAWRCEDGPEFTIEPVARRLRILWRHRAPAQPLWAQSDNELFYPQDFAAITLIDAAGARTLRYQSPGAARASCALRRPEP